MIAPIDLRRILQEQLKALDAKLSKIEPQHRAAQSAFEDERRAAEQRLAELGARWRKVNEVYIKTREEREQVFQALGEL